MITHSHRLQCNSVKISINKHQQPLTVCLACSLQWMHSMQLRGNPPLSPSPSLSYDSLLSVWLWFPSKERSVSASTCSLPSPFLPLVYLLHCRTLFHLPTDWPPLISPAVQQQQLAAPTHSHNEYSYHRFIKTGDQVTHQSSHRVLLCPCRSFNSCPRVKVVRSYIPVPVIFKIIEYISRNSKNCQ